MKKLLIFGIIALFICMGIQPAFANNVYIESNKTKENNDSTDIGFSFILCEVYHFFYILRIRRRAFFVNFEIRDFDTGELIQEKSRLFGIHLFSGLHLGKNYEITVTTSYDSKTIIIKDIGFFNYKTLDIIVV